MRTLGEFLPFVLGYGGGAVAAFFFLNRWFGWKVAGIVAALILGAGLFHKKQAEAKQSGVEEERERQRARDREVLTEAEKARRQAEEEFDRRGGTIDENDPHLRD